jgi:hypothetical protein
MVLVFSLHGRTDTPSFKGRKPNPSDFTGGELAPRDLQIGYGAVGAVYMLQQWTGDRLEQRIVEVNTLTPTPTKDA